MNQPNDTNEPSSASAGSHGQVSVSVHIDDSACAFPASRPLRRPRLTLTDAEREAIELAIETWVCKPQLKATLRGLLERQG
jgi:hypothetical protein